MALSSKLRIFQNLKDYTQYYFSSLQSREFYTALTRNQAKQNCNFSLFSTMEELLTNFEFS